MDILVTGATGFIGSYLIKTLSMKKHKIRCLVRESSNIESLKKLDVELWFGDLNDKKTLKGVTRGVDIVFHLAAIGDINATSEKYYTTYSYVNVDGTKNLLEECIKHDIKKFVHFSSVAAMGDLKKKDPISEKDKCKPKTPYEKSKRKSELVALSFWKKYRIPVVILRPTMVYGEGAKKESSKIEKSVKLKIVPILGNGNNLIHMVHVKNVVQAAILAAKRGKAGEIYIISDEFYTWNETVNLVAQKMGIKTFKIHIPIFIAKPFVILIEEISKILNFIPPFTSRRLEGLSTNVRYDLSKTEKELNYKPTIKFFSKNKCK